MILSRESMQAVERQTIDRGIPAGVLMETAGAKLARCITQFFPAPGLLVCYAGKGHNAGDAFVAARHLAMHGWRILVRTPFNRGDFAPLTREKLDLLGPAATIGADYEMRRSENLGLVGPPGSSRKMFLRARPNSIEGGTSEIQRNIIGERVLGLPGEPRTDKDRPWKDVPRS